MNTLEYLDAVKAKAGITSDYQLAQLLESSTPVISQYRTRKRTMDDYTAARVAELLGIEELEIIAQANAEREKDAKKRAYWEEKAKAVRQRTGGPLGNWRARRDSNARPLPSEGSTLSS